MVFSSAEIPKTYRCSECGARNPDWLQYCPACGRMGVMQVDLDEPTHSHVDVWSPEAETDDVPAVTRASTGNELVPSDVPVTPDDEYVTTGFMSVDYLLNGGLVKGQGILAGGEPGIGKTTLLMSFAGLGGLSPSLYISGEQSQRALVKITKRCGFYGKKNLFLLSSSSMEEAWETVQRRKIKLLIVDSIQTMTTDAYPKKPAGNPIVMKHVIQNLCVRSQKEGRTVVVVGQVNKDGTFEGPKSLQHFVDTLLFFDGTPKRPIRTLRCLKNREGPSDRVARLRMTARGLVELDDVQGPGAEEPSDDEEAEPKPRSRKRAV